MQVSPHLRLVLAVLCCGVLVAGAGVARASDDPVAPWEEGSEVAPPPDDGETGPEDAKLELRLHGKGNVRVGSAAQATGVLKPFAPDQRVEVELLRDGKTVVSKTKRLSHVPDKDAAKFTFARRITEPGHYKITAVHEESNQLGEAKGKTRRFKIVFPSLHQGDRGSDVRLLKHSLDKLGYVPGGGQSFNDRTARAVLAFRKVNGMARTTSATSSIFKRAAAGRGTYKLRNPGAGKHVEVNIGRQVMVLADDGKAQRIYHVSTGAAATPTIRGSYRFYRREPGTNSKGMYMSTYFIRGYAVHGYPSVPTYPASHGCVRVPMSDAVSIYNWIQIGMPIFTY